MFKQISLFAIGVTAVSLMSACATSQSASSEPKVAANPAAPNPQITLVKDKHAMESLEAMARALSSASSMSFTATVMKPLRGPNNQWVHVLTTEDVEMQRPDKLTIVSGGDAFPQHVFYDGKNLSIAAPQVKLYSSESLSGNIDSMLAEASKKGGATFPFSDVLLSDPLTSWEDGLEGAAYVGESIRNGEKLEHIALSAKDVDWEIWIDKKLQVPRIVFVKFTGEHRSPSVLIEFSKWKLNQKIPGSHFAFKPLKDAKKVSFSAPGGTNK